MENYNFKPGELVIYKQPNGVWTVGIFSHIAINEKPASLDFYIVNGEWFNTEDNMMLPLKGYEYLVGTKNEIEKEIILQEGELILASDYLDYIKGFLGEIIEYNNTTQHHIVGKRGNTNYHYKFCLPLKDFDSKDLIKSRKNILKVRNGKLIKAF